MAPRAEGGAINYSKLAFIKCRAFHRRRHLRYYGDGAETGQGHFFGLLASIAAALVSIINAGQTFNFPS